MSKRYQLDLSEAEALELAIGWGLVSAVMIGESPKKFVQQLATTEDSGVTEKLGKMVDEMTLEILTQTRA